MKNLLLSFALFFSYVIVAQESNTIKYGNLLEFKIPEKYELRTNAELNRNKDLILKELDFKGSKSQYILQPKGMNKTAGKIDYYSKILIKIEYGNFESNNNIAEYTQEKLDNLEKYFKSAIEKLPNTRIIYMSPVKKITLINKNFINFETLGVTNQDPLISDRIMTFMDKTYLIRFTISYRVSEEEYWSNDIQEFLNSIIIKDKVIKRVLPQKVQKVQKKKLTPMQLKVLQDSQNPNNDASLRSMQSINKQNI
ncbi:hypothetical protein [Flavobacterium sp. DSR2-3-3]|uniref:hypothetical protein n=1 Tax=Flavobacterium sp. DSR2-3-3 TaxID=2804632 RepID=UPI003CF5987E